MTKSRSKFLKSSLLENSRNKPNFTFSYLDEGMDLCCIFTMTYSVEGNSVAWLSWLTAAVLAWDFILFTAIMFTAGNNSELFWLGRGREADTCSKLPGY